MKSERRHELQTNKLADWLGHQADNVKPHANLILTAVLAIAAVVLAWVYFRESNASRTTAAWSDFYSAANTGDAAALVEMAKDHAGEPASLWATLLASDMHLETGAGQAFRDRQQAETSLKSAIAGYEAVLSDDVHGRQPLLRRRAMFGLAEAHEALFAVTAKPEDLEAAREFYNKTAQAWPDTVLGRSAEEKAADLSSPSTEEFLVWFSKQEPVSQEMPSAGESPTGPESPFDLTTLPGADELLLPEEDAAAESSAGPPATEGNDAASETPEATPPDGSAASGVDPAPGDSAAPAEPDDNAEPQSEPAAAEDAAATE